jgi:hypothetical protein
MTLGFMVKPVTRFNGFPNAETSGAADLPGHDLSAAPARSDKGSAMLDFLKKQTAVAGSWCAVSGSAMLSLLRSCSQLKSAMPNV